MHEDLRVQVKEAMAVQDVSARELARRAEVELNTVLDFLHGRRNTSSLIRRAFCQQLGLDYVQTQNPQPEATT